MSERFLEPQWVSASRPAWTVLSARDCVGGPAMGCVMEMELVAVEALKAELVCPQPLRRSKPSWLSRVSRQFPGASPSDQLRVRSEPRVSGDRRGEAEALLVVSLNRGRLDILDALPDWRRRFDVVVAYVFDSFEGDWGVDPADLDAVFVPIRASVEELRPSLGERVHELPMAADVRRFGSPRPSAARWIDVNGYGRQRRDHLETIADYFNRPGGAGVAFHEGLIVRDQMRQRALFWQLLTHSRIALAYDVRTTGGDRFPYSIVSQRWFESLAAGCAVMGCRPCCPEVDELLNWPEATIELPNDPQDALAAVCDLLDQPARLDAIAARNYQQVLERHDWRHRITDMLATLGMSEPAETREAGAAMLADDRL